MRRRLPWLLAVPLMAAGSLTAHAASSALGLAGQHAERAVETEGVVERSGAAPASFGVLVLGLLTAFAVVAAIRCLPRGSRGRGASPWLFLALPPLAFSAQEALERLLSAEAAPFAAAHEPRFWLALLVQVPFGVAALLAARLLWRVVERIARALAEPPAAALSVLIGAVSPRLAVAAPRIAALALGHAERGPPTRT